MQGCQHRMRTRQAVQEHVRRHRQELGLPSDDESASAEDEKIPYDGRDFDHLWTRESYSRRPRGHSNQESPVAAMLQSEKAGRTGKTSSRSASAQKSSSSPSGTSTPQRRLSKPVLARRVVIYNTTTQRTSGGAACPMLRSVPSWLQIHPDCYVKYRSDRDKVEAATGIRPRSPPPEIEALPTRGIIPAEDRERCVALRWSFAAQLRCDQMNISVVLLLLLLL